MQPTTAPGATAGPAVKPWLIAAAVYAVLVLLMWAPFGIDSRMPIETFFPYNSDTTSKLDGFIYHADPMRIHTNTFYHLAHLLADWWGMDGAFVTYQIVYAFLWWGRSVLVFLTLLRFLPNRPLFCYSAGAVSAVHSADGALNWIGQMNQLGYLFWMVLAYLCLVRAYQSGSRWKWPLLLLAAMVFAHMSLWSYESQIFIMAALPLLLSLAPGAGWRRLLSVAGGWYAVLAAYTLLMIQRFASVAGSTYQVSVMRKEMSPAALLSDFAFNLQHSLSFWRWSDHVTEAALADAGQLAVWCAAWAAAVVCAGGWLVSRSSERCGQDAADAGWPRRFAAAAAVGALLLALSFPAYLMLQFPRTLYRTQFLGGIGAALVLTGGCCLCARIIARRRYADLAFLALCVPIVFCGARAAVRLGAGHHHEWQCHRQVIAQVLAIAPRVEPGTLVVLVDVPKPPVGAPFFLNMWCDHAMRLAYPRVPVSGVYYNTDGTPAPDMNMRIDGNDWCWDGSGHPLLLQKTGVEHTVAISFASARARLLHELPACLGASPEASACYDPQRNIKAGPPSRKAVRRYGPIPVAALDP